MCIRNLLATETNGLTESASNQIRDIINDFFNACITTAPDKIYQDYWRGDDSIMNKVGKWLATDYPLTVHYGYNRTNTFFVTSIKYVKLGDIIETVTKKKFVVGESFFKKYTFESFRQLSHIVLAMTFAKYDVTSLYKEHIFFTLLAVMFRLYRVYENGQWLVNTIDVARLLTEVMDMDIVQFDYIATQYGFKNSSDVRTRTINIKRKPTCAEDLTSCFADGMTQTEKKAAIMKWWRCGERTARKYMQQFGLTDCKYTRSDYKEVHEHIDEAVEAVSEQINEATDAIVEHIDDATDTITEKLSIIQDGIFNLQQKFG